MIGLGGGTSRVKGNWKPSAEILDAETGKPVVSLKLTTNDEDTVLAATERVSHFEVKAVAFSPDGKSVAVLCGGRSIRFLETETGIVMHEIRSADSPQGGRWTDFAITPQGHMLAIGGVDKHRTVSSLQKGTVELWDFDGPGTAANSAPLKDGGNQDGKQGTNENGGRGK